MSFVSNAGRLCLMTTVLVAAGCKDDKTVPRAPVLKNLFIVEPGSGTETDLLLGPDASVAGRVFSPLSSFRAVFDDFLLGVNLEDLDAGVSPRGDVAVVTWVDAPPAATRIMGFTSYNPAGFDLTMRRTYVGVIPRPGLPSGATVRLQLPRDKVVGRNGRLPFAGTDEFTIQTAPFEATFNLMPMTPVAADFQLTVTFSNLVSPTASMAISARSGDAPVMVEVTPDMQNPRAFVVAPMGGKWTAGATYSVTVAESASDQFGVKLPAPVTLMFDVTAPATDASAPDASAGDALSPG